MGTSMRKGLQAVVMAGAMGAALALSAGQAHAATGVTANSAFININAAADKANQIIINPSGSNITVIDNGDTVTAGAGCTQLSANSVSCPAGTRTILLSAGDRNDTVILRASLRATLNGDAGGDTLQTIDSTQRAVLVEGDGNDTLIGGAGDDEIVGGAAGTSWTATPETTGWAPSTAWEATTPPTATPARTSARGTWATRSSTARAEPLIRRAGTWYRVPALCRFGSAPSAASCTGSATGWPPRP